jgi:alpha-tubulin suppressor-like RCC1 family protein
MLMPFMAPAASASAAKVTPMATAGFYHSLVLRDDGTVWIWGRNDSGQLGDGTTADKTTPVMVKVKDYDGTLVPLSGVAALAGGSLHSLALDMDGTVWAWGSNGYGQVGDGTSGSGASRLTPVKVLGEGGAGYLSNVKAIAAGTYHSLALDYDGTVWIWGGNSEGQLGIGTNDYFAHPVPVRVKVKDYDGTSVPLSGVKAIAAGTYHSLALDYDGTVWAWGYNKFGQLGDGTSVNKNTVVQAKNLFGITVIVSGGTHSLGFTDDGTVWAWGGNGSGQLGDGTTADHPAPVMVKVKDHNGTSVPLAGVAALAGGASHSLALDHDGTILTWGSNSNGQLGNGARNVNKYTPVYVVDSAGQYFTGVTALAKGHNHSLAIRNYCEVWTWGSNDYGQVGDDTSGSGVSRLTPIQVSGGETGDEYLSLCTPPDPATPTDPITDPMTDTAGTITGLAAGGFHSLALKEGKVLSWGKNNFGQLGDGTIKSNHTPSQVKGEDGMDLTDVTAVAAGTYHSLALKEGKVLAWGKNNIGQLGDGTKTNRRTPVHTSGLSGIVAIAAGCSHSLALDNDGTVWVWGRNSFSQLGDGTKTSRLIPVPVLSGVTAIAAKGDYSLALDNDGMVWSWGRNNFGQLGDGTKTNKHIPVRIGLSAKAIVAGGYHSLALDNDGMVWSWGRNNNGQLGDGTNINRYSPTPVDLNAAALTAGWYHSFALGSNGTVWAWGRNGSGQLGDGTIKGSLTPVQIGLYAKILAAGGWHSLALRDNDEVWSWGHNGSGQLGNGTTKRYIVPTRGMEE